MKIKIKMIIRGGKNEILRNWKDGSMGRWTEMDFVNDYDIKAMAILIMSCHDMIDNYSE